MPIPQWDTEFEPTGPFKDKFKHGIRRQKEFCTTAIIALYANYGDFPLLMDERRYQESLKAGKILNMHEFDLIMRNEPLPLTPMQEVIDTVRSKEPKPPGREMLIAGHHWLDEYDMDGHFFGRIVLQWNPGAKRWSHSGMVATGSYVDTTYWRYVAPCPIPE